MKLKNIFNSLLISILSHVSVAQDNTFNTVKEYFKLDTNFSLVSTKIDSLKIFEEVVLAKKINFAKHDNIYLVMSTNQVEEPINALIVDLNDKYIIYKLSNINTKLDLVKQLCIVTVYNKNDQSMATFRVIDNQITSYTEFFKQKTESWRYTNYYLERTDLNTRQVNFDYVLSYTENYQLYASSFYELSQYYYSEFSFKIDRETLGGIIWW